MEYVLFEHKMINAQINAILSEKIYITQLVLKM